MCFILKLMLGDQKKLGERCYKETQHFMCNDSRLENLIGPFGRCVDFKLLGRQPLHSTKGQSSRIVQPAVIVGHNVGECSRSTVCLRCVFFAQWFLSCSWLIHLWKKKVRVTLGAPLVLTGYASQWRQRRPPQVWAAGEGLPAKHSSDEQCICGPSEHSSQPLQLNLGSCFYVLDTIVPPPPPPIQGFAFCSFDFLWSTKVWKY